MDRKTIVKLIITAVLIMILIFVSNNARESIKRTKERRRKTLHSEVLQEQPRMGKTIYRGDAYSRGNEVLETGLYKKLEEEAGDLTLKRDPFFEVSIMSEKTSISHMKLGGIIWDESAPLAMIDDTAVGKGDRISDYIVVDIKKDSVILSDGTQEHTLRMGF